MDNSRNIFIDKHSALFWYTPQAKKHEISDGLLVETILNYGTLADYKELLSMMGEKNVASVFFSMKERQKMNFYPEIYHYFSLMLAKYA